MSLLRYEKKSLFRFHSLFLYNLPSTTSRMGKNGAASSLTFTQLDCARLSLLWPACSVQTVRVFSPSRLHVVSGEEAENLKMAVVSASVFSIYHSDMLPVKREQEKLQTILVYIHQFECVRACVCVCSVCDWV